MTHERPPWTASRFRRALQDAEPVVGHWSLIGDPAVVDLASSTDVDYVVMDLQHGSYSELMLPGLTALVARRGVLPLVRTRSHAFADIGRPLDLGALGVLIPSTSGVAEAREAIRSARYGPNGTRSIGRLIEGEEDPIAILVLETARSLEDLDDILGIEGLDAIYVGPVDLALALGKHGPDGASEMASIVKDIMSACIARGVPVGVHTDSADVAAAHRDDGALLLTSSVDLVGVRDLFHARTRSGLIAHVGGGGA